MLKFIILVASVLIGIFLIGAIIFIFSSRKNRVSNSEEQLEENVRLIENQRTIWMRRTRRTVEVKPFGFFEEFASFPYLTDFKNTRAFLLKKNVSFKAIETFLLEMDKIQNILFNEFRNQQKKLLLEFDNANIQDTPSNRDFLMEYYIKNLDNFMLIMTNGFNKTILSKKIAFLLGSDNFNEQPMIEKLLQQLITNTTNLINDLIKNASIKHAKENQDYFAGNNFTRGQAFRQNSQHQQNHQSYNNEHKNNNWQEFDDDAWAYKTLGLKENASFDEVKKQYKKLAMQYHPDRNPSEPAKQKMIEINQAYDYIKKINNK